MRKQGCGAEVDSILAPHPVKNTILPAFK